MELRGLLATPMRSWPGSRSPTNGARSGPVAGEWLGHPDRDEVWHEVSYLERVDRVAMPVLQVAGWFDLFVDSGLRSFARMRAEGEHKARTEQRLIIGPWDHLNKEGMYHERDFGRMAASYAADLAGAHVRFFDRHLRDNADTDIGASPVRIFVMGIDQWRDEAGLAAARHHLRGLPPRAPTTRSRPSCTSTDGAETFLYDPADPVPTLGGRIILPVPVGTGPVDQRPVEERADVLCFTTPVLDQPVEVTGHVSLVLYASSSALDTDFTGKLVDVFPDGRALYLTDGILRARYRHR